MTEPAAEGTVRRIAAPSDAAPTIDHLGQTQSGPTEPPPASLGRFAVEGEIGQGGMGSVLRGRDPDLDRDLALKILLTQHRGKPELERRFLEEARIAGRLDHPGVPAVHELGRADDGRPFFAMKLIRGRNLADLLRERNDPKEDLPRFLSVFEQICQTLAYAHTHGVIHRDLKPANVMVGRFGEVQVMDWGLAKVLSEPQRPAASAVPVSVFQPSDAGLSQAGAVLGTPAYMSPEQARGQTDKLDERTDVFGLGAILCEILTGKPPFAAEETSVLIRRAARGELSEVVARLDGCGADAELVALARVCLAAEASDRPRDASVVATRITSHRADVERRLHAAEVERAAAQARADAAKAKAKAERRARRMTLGLALAALLLLLLGGGALAWWWGQRVAMVQDVEAALADVNSNIAAGRWPEARAALERAEGRMGGAGPDALRTRAKQARDDLDFVSEVEAVRLRHADLREGKWDFLRTDRAYAEVFRRHGLDVEALAPEETAARLRGSAVRGSLLAAMDHWQFMRTPDLRQPLLAAMNEADPDDWRRAFREAAAHSDLPRLKTLAARAEMTAQTPIVQALLGEVLFSSGLPEEGAKLLTLAQQGRPGDFWINFSLGTILINLKPPRAEEAVGYFRAAAAARPNTAAVAINLSSALRSMGDLDGALALCRKAVDVDSTFATAHYNLGLTYYEKKNYEAARACYRRTLELDPSYIPAYNDLGNILYIQKDLDGAAVWYRKANERDAKLAYPLHNLGCVLRDKGNPEEAIACFRKALAINPNYPEAYQGLASVLDDQDDPQGAIENYRKALALDPRNVYIHYELAGVLYAEEDWDAASAEYRKVLEIDPRHTAGHLSLGLALYQKQELDAAIASYRRALELDPKYTDAHSNLALALFDDNSFDGAIEEYRKAIALNAEDPTTHYGLGRALSGKGDLDAAVASYRQAIKLNAKYVDAHRALGGVFLDKEDWDQADSSYRKAQEFSADAAATNRIVERLELRGKFPAFLKGDFRPATNRERLTMAWFCRQGRKRYHAAARLYAEVFADEPKLAEDQDGRRYEAARASLLAAAGKGEDAAELKDEERTRLRGQARDWLRAELVLWEKRVGDKSVERAAMQAKLRDWQSDADLAAVRDAVAVENLPEAERKEWRKLWGEVAEQIKRGEGK